MSNNLNDYSVLIAVPSTGYVPTEFMESLLKLQKPKKTQFAMISGSLVYNARNKLALQAFRDPQPDYIFWLDSDMVFEPDTLLRLLADAVENDLDYITGLYFKRTYPTTPLIGKTLEWEQDRHTGALKKAEADPYTDYPKDSIFEIKCSGFGCLLMKTSIIAEAAELRRASPFEPLPGLSEDYSFCYTIKQLGKRMWCDSAVKAGHVGKYIYGEDTWIKQQEDPTNDGNEL